MTVFEKKNGDYEKATSPKKNKKPHTTKHRPRFPLTINSCMYN